MVFSSAVIVESAKKKAPRPYQGPISEQWTMDAIYESHLCSRIKEKKMYCLVRIRGSSETPKREFNWGSP